MATQPNLRVRISADLADIKQGLAVLRGDLAKVKKETSAASGTKAWTAGLGEVKRALAGVVSLYSAMRGVRWYLDQADQAANLAARQRLATKGQEDFTRAYKGTYDIAQRTSAEWESVVGLYSQLAQTTGMGQERILALTETISQAFQVSGASAQETSIGLRQLQQAMAGGVLRAEEFNTIIDTSPRIVQALADYFGIAFGQVRNALLALVGDADTGSGASSDLAISVQDLARTLESEDVRSGFATIIGALSQVVAWATKATAAVGNLIKEYKEALQQKGLVAGKTEAELEARRDRLVEFRRTARGRVFNAIGGYVDQEITRIDNLIEDLRKRYTVLMSDEQDMPESMLKSVDSGKGSGKGTGDTAKAIAKSNALIRDSVARALAELERLYQGHEISAAEYFQARRKLSEEAIDLEIQQAQYEMAVTKDLGARRKLEEQIIILQRDRAELAGKAAREQQKAEEELAASLADVELQLMRLNGKTAAAERASLETTYKALKEQLQRSGNEAGVATVNALIDGLVARAQSEELQEAASRIGQTLQGIETSVSAQSAAGMLGGVESERRMGEARAQALAQYRELREKAIAYLQSLDPSSPEAANARLMLQQLNGDILGILESQNQLRRNVMEAGTGAFGSFFANLREGAMSAREMLEQLGLDFVTMLYDMQAKVIASKLGEKLGGLFALGDATDVAAGAIALEGAAGSTMAAGAQVQGAAVTLGTSAAALMAAAQELIVAYSMGGIGTLGGSMGFWPVGVAHTGAMVGKWRVRRSVSPLLFGQAPRYHTGSPRLGLRPGEHPAILKDGERVLNEQQNKLWEAMLKGGGKDGQAGLNVEINIENRGGSSLQAGIEDVRIDGAKLVLNLVASDIDSGGVVGQAVNRRTGTTFRGYSRG